MRYEIETVARGPDGGFLVEGRIVHVIRTRGADTVTALVEKPGGDSDGPAVFNAKGDRVGIGPTCLGTKDDGSRCSREVDEPGDLCWQHLTEDD